MSRDEESLHRSRENMRMTAVKTVPRTVVQKGPRTIEGDGKAKRKLARGMTHFYRGLDMLRFELFSQGVGQAGVRCNRLVSGRPGLQSGSRTDIIRVSNGRQSGMS